jgi:hypothetical protein
LAWSPELACLAIDLPPEAPTTRYIDQPDWNRTLSPAEGEALFPAKALSAKLTSGKATVDCVIDDTGALKQCQVLGESPAGMDFGPAAVTAASAMQVNLWTRVGAPTPGAHIRADLAGP